MKNTITLILIVLTLFSCKREIISVEGYLIDERTGNNFNPFANAQVRLVVDKSYGYYDELGSCEVDQNGYYKIMAKQKKTGFQARLQLNTRQTFRDNIDHSITVGTNVQHDFIITCPVEFNRVFVNQTATNFDSIQINITNSKGLNVYTKLLNGNYTSLTIPKLVGDEKNYLTSYIYANGGFATRYDTIYSGCRTTVNDSIKY